VTYTPHANYNGPDSFSFRANDGMATSGVATVSLAVNAVNDAPVFTKGADQTANEDSGAQSITGWATGISAGPANESGQGLTFLLSNDNASLFSAQPAIDATGRLTFTPVGGATGLARVTVRLRDNGGTANGGLDISAAQTFTITVIVPVVPEISIADASVLEGNSGTTPLVFTVRLSAPSTTPVSMNYQTLNGTASAPKDFQATSGTLTFAPGEIVKTITVSVSGDTSREHTETLLVRLSNAVGAPFVDSDAMGLILDDESMVISLSKADSFADLAYSTGWCAPGAERVFAQAPASLQSASWLLGAWRPHGLQALLCTVGSYQESPDDDDDDRSDKAGKDDDDKSGRGGKDGDDRSGKGGKDDDDKSKGEDKNSSGKSDSSGKKGKSQ
jgi:hypothetical protein